MAAIRRRAYIERGVRSISTVGDLASFQRFVSLCAGRTSQLLDSSALASGCGIAQGLASCLLGFRTVEQLRSHPLRAAFLETWVVSEIHEHRQNRGEPGGLSFDRDQNGVEVDLIVEGADQLTLVEARAAQTQAPHHLDSLRQVRTALEGTPVTTAVVVYGGAVEQRRSDGALVARSSMHEERRVR